MMLKITSAFALAAVVLTGIVLVNGQNNNNNDENVQQQQQTGGGIRRLSESNNSNNSQINREWLNKFVVTDPTSRSNPNHHRAMVEMLIRYGTSHVGKSLSMDDVRDALAIEFLSHVDGRPIPIAGSDDSLFIGTIGSAYNLEGLTDAGITHIVSAARSARLNYSDQIHYKRIAIADDNIKETPEEMMDMFLSTCNYIDHAIRNGGKVLVHDWEGAGRSGAFIVAYIMRTRKMTYSRALEVVRESRSIVSPSKSLVQNLELWEKMLGLNRDILVVDEHKHQPYYSGVDNSVDNDDEGDDEVVVDLPTTEEMSKMFSKNKFLADAQ